MTTRAAAQSDLRAFISECIFEVLETLAKPQEGTIIGQSYEPATGASSVLFGDTYALLGDDGDTFINHPGLPLATSQIGDQSGPVGNERIVAIPSPTGYVLHFVHGEDDSPNVPAGERWILHRSEASWNEPAPVWDAGLKHTNDAATPGDGLGGALYGLNAGLTKATTRSGHTVALDDTAKTITITSATGHVVTIDDNAATSGVTVRTAGGMLGHFDDVAQAITHQAASGVYSIVDGAGNIISQVATSVGLGGAFASLPASKGAINNDILTTFGSNINSANLQTLINFGNAMITAGIPNASSLIPLIIASLINDVTIPAGSSLVRINS